MLKIFNTLTLKKEIFKPIHAGKINIYVCGTTVYDMCHLGHGRTFVIFDVIIRYLRYQGFEVNYVRNITDIEDKIIKCVIESGEPFHHFVTRMIREMHYDFDALHILRPNYEPRVTHYIDKIIELIKRLIFRKHAYISESGDVMFSINSCKNYGCLSKQNLNQLKIGARVKPNKTKHSYADFVLWKIAKPSEPSWPSPWGKGRPGWHIECSAINNYHFGHNCDIHGGGFDLIFPHHENEIAQSTCAYEGPYVKIWMHVGVLTINRRKMSKSSKNFFTIRDILHIHDEETIRYFLISVHYRSRFNYSQESLTSARAALERLYFSLRDTDITAVPSGGSQFVKQFIEAMDDDFNTPKACSILFDIAHKINQLKNDHASLSVVHGMAATLRYLANILGLLKKDSNSFLHQKASISSTIISNCEVERLIQLRSEARKNRQWSVADALRNHLAKQGILLEDRPNGTMWRRA